MSKFKYQLTEQKTDKRFEKGEIDVEGGAKTTVSDVDPQTGTVTFDVEYLPDFEKLFDDFAAVLKSSRDIAKETKEDPKFEEFFIEIRKLRNAVRTHLRNEYPKEYRQIKDKAGLAEVAVAKKVKDLSDDALKALIAKVSADKSISDVGKYLKDKLDINISDSKVKSVLDKSLPKFESSMTGGGVAGASFTPGVGGQYATPYAFNKNKNADGTDRDILTKKYGFKIAKNQVTENENPGAILGPGPKAGKEGVEDNYYVKAFGFKRVPKKIKGSGLEVKQLWKKN